MHFIRLALGALCSISALILLVVCIALGLYVPGAGSTLLYAMLIVCVVSFATSGFALKDQPTPISYWNPLLAAAVWWVLAVGMTQWTHGVFHASGLEKAIRALCVIPVVYYFCKAPPQLMRHVQWAFMIATLSGAWGLIFPKVVFTDGLARPNTAQYALYNTVGFANIVMLFASLSLASIGWRLTRFTRTEAALKIIVAVIGFYGVLQSQTRSSLLAIPVFIGIAYLAHCRVGWRARVALGVVAIAVITVLGTSRIVQERVDLAYTEVEQCVAEPKSDTSVCIRLQLLRAASVMFKENKAFGVGDGHLFVNAMNELGDRGIISRYVADSWGETHNDISFMAAAYGLFGVIPFALCFFGVPAWMFVRHLRFADANSRTAAVMGLLVVMGFFTFGLTEAMFRSMRTVSAYAVLVALLLALSRPASNARLFPRRADPSPSSNGV